MNKQQMINEIERIDDEEESLTLNEATEYVYDWKEEEKDEQVRKLNQ